MEGTSTLISTNFEMSAFTHVKAIVLAPLALAETTAFIQFCEDPLVVSTSRTERIDGHYRRFIVLDELKERLSQASFKVVHAVESDGLSAHGNDNPVVIRLTAERVVGFEYLVSTPYALEPDNLTFTS